MTEADIERSFALGIAAMFGSVPVWLLVAWIVGRLKSSFEVGAGIGMTLFGLTGLVAGTIFAFKVESVREVGVQLGVFGAFGGFWFLAGLVMLASLWESRRPASKVTAVTEKALSPARQRWATLATVIGNLLVFGCVIVATLTDWDGKRSTLFVFRGVAVACVFFGAALFLRRNLRLSSALTLLIIGGGFALAAWSLQVLG